jgi:hypothetical protein
MKIITIGEYAHLNEDQKKIYLAFYNAEYYDCIIAKGFFLKDRDIFREDVLWSEKYKSAANYNQQQYLKNVGKSRFDALKSIAKLPILQRFSLEFFNDHQINKLLSEPTEILLTYRNQKKLAYALLS